MLIKWPSNIRPSEITPEAVYRERRQFMQGLLCTTALSITGSAAGVFASPRHVAPEDAPTGPAWLQQQMTMAEPELQNAEELTPYKDITSYNNFYEFGMKKDDPAKNSQTFNPHPWKVTISGEANKTGEFQLEDLLRGLALEERIYRLRCVEAWSMVIPWIGFPLANLLKRFEPSSKAKYVAFTTLLDPEQMPGQKSRLSAIDWPYVEGLRIDEAMHPLTMLAVGLYGKILPNQNGAPLRLVVPWKYGFKSIKSIVKIEFSEQQPVTTWNKSAPKEYGFFANVNPSVDHPRWSQATERRLPSGLFSPNIIKTQMFNGYADEVASLYQGMDLSRYY